MQLSPQALFHVRSFLDLPDDAQKDFLKALKNADADFNIYDLANEIVRQLPLPRALVVGFLQSVALMYLEKEKYPGSLEAFLDSEVKAAIKNGLVAQSRKPAKDETESSQTSPKEEEIEGRWVKIRQFLAVALTLDKTVGTAAKAGPVMTDHEHIFVDARILSDVRLVFHPDVSERPDAAAIVHMLRITTRDIFGAYKTEYFALDSNDIRLMKQLMERAAKKEDTIIKTMESSGVKILTPKGIF